MIKNLLTINYHPELIDIVIKNSFIGILSVNIIMPILISIAIQDYMPIYSIYIWLGFNTIFFIIRFTIIKKISVLMKINNNIALYIHMMIFTIFLTAVLYGYALFYAYSYIPELELFFMATMIMVLVSGSLSTLSGIYQAFAVFVIFFTIPVIILFLFQNGIVYKIFSLTAFIFLFVLLKNGYKQYIIIKETIFLKDDFKQKKKEVEDQKKSFEAIYNNSKDAIAILDMDSKFLQVNPAYVEMIGYSEEELLNTSCLKLTLDKDVELSKKSDGRGIKSRFYKEL